MTEVIKEVRGEFADVVVISELRGDYPAVDYFDGVDIAELTRGDSDPVFLTLPIGKVNVTSGNQRYYDDTWLAELERQVAAKRPTGMMGHEDDDPMTFPPEAIFWVGARRIGELLWGKGYLPPGAPRDRIRRYKAANKTLGTSIFAMAEGIWNQARGAYEMLAKTLDLRRIDIGPVDKLGIKDLALVPILTAEMIAPADDGAETVERTMAEAIKELKELRNVAVPARSGWAGSKPAVPQDDELAQIREMLGLDEKASVKQAVSELQAARAEQAKTAVQTRISELVSDAEKGIKVESVRGLVTELVNARNPQTPQEAESAYAQVLELQSVKDTLAATVRSTMGPPQRTPVAPQHNKINGGGFFTYPQEDK